METEVRAGAESDKQSLVVSNNSNPWNAVSLVGLIISVILVLISVILSGLTYSEVNSSSLCSNDVTYNECYFDTVTSLNVAGPPCGEACINTVTTARKSYEAKAGVALSVLKNLVGDVRLVFNDLTGNYTLLSEYNGAINSLQPLLCNLTEATNVTYSVFQYYHPNFQRVVTTVPEQNGENAICTYLSHNSSAYKPLLNQQTYSGEVSIFQKDYYGIYQPFWDAITNNYIGVLFVGVGY